MGLKLQDLQHKEVFLAVGPNLNSQNQLREVFRVALVLNLSSQHHRGAIFSVRQINQQNRLRVFSGQVLRQRRHLQQALFLGILKQPRQDHLREDLVFLVQVVLNLNRQLPQQLVPVTSQAVFHQVEQVQPALLQVLQQLAYFYHKTIRNLNQQKIYLQTPQLLNNSQLQVVVSLVQ